MPRNETIKIKEPNPEERSPRYKREVRREIRSGIKYNGKFSIKMAPFLKDYAKSVIQPYNRNKPEDTSSHMIIVLPQKMYYDGKIKLEEFGLSAAQFVGTCLGALIMEQPEMVEFVKKFARTLVQKDRYVIDFKDSLTPEEPMSEPDFENTQIDDVINEELCKNKQTAGLMKKGD